MTATIHRLHNSNPIAGYLRVGHSDHKWLEDQQARGALPYRRFVFEAALFRGNTNSLVILGRGA
jgi:hypothetical protein